MIELTHHLGHLPEASGSYNPLKYNSGSIGSCETLRGQKLIHKCISFLQILWANDTVLLFLCMTKDFSS